MGSRGGACVGLESGLWLGEGVWASALREALQLALSAGAERAVTSTSPC